MGLTPSVNVPCRDRVLSKITTNEAAAAATAASAAEADAAAAASSEHHDEKNDEKHDEKHDDKQYNKKSKSTRKQAAVVKVTAYRNATQISVIGNRLPCCIKTNILPSRSLKPSSSSSSSSGSRSLVDYKASVTATAGRATTKVAIVGEYTGKAYVISVTTTHTKVWFSFAKALRFLPCFVEDKSVRVVKVEYARDGSQGEGLVKDGIEYLI